MARSSKTVIDKALTWAEDKRTENSDNNPIEWHKRMDQTSEWWKLSFPCSGRLEKAYSEYLSQGRQQNLSEICFDDYNAHVLVDFNKMIVSPSNTNHVTLFHLKRRYAVLGKFI